MPLAGQVPLVRRRWPDSPRFIRNHSRTMKGGGIDSPVSRQHYDGVTNLGPRDVDRSVTRRLSELGVERVARRGSSLVVL